jgi:hypothetical protein
MRKIFHQGNLSLWLGLAAGIFYGGVARFVFSYRRFDEVFYGVLTISFIILVPLTLGVLTVYFGVRQKRRSWAYWIFMPWVPCVILMATALLIGWEGSICILMALPVFLVLSSFGGLLAGISTKDKQQDQTSYSLLTFFILLPFVFGAIERRLGLPDSIRTVETQITINASPQKVWESIIRVPVIKPGEQRFSVFHLIGFPRPVEATLSREGVGGVRNATFEGGVLFVETIDKWDPEKELSFGIKADTKSIPPTTLDEHVTIGGPYFDMLEGAYRLERVNDSQVVLHLSSRHRLSTRINFYAGLWTSFIMKDIQDNILGVIKERSETRTK